MPGAAAASLAPRLALFFVLGFFLLQALARLLYPLFGLLIASVLGVFAAAAIANSLALRIFERGHLPDIGLHWNPASVRNLVVGTVGGCAAGAAVVLLPAAAGLATWKAAPGETTGAGGFLFLTAMLLFGAVGEEMLFRGYGFQVLVPVAGPMATILPMGVLFAAAHMDNQNVSWLGLINTFLWGVLLGAALLRSGDLWMPIGLHFGWNWILPLLGVNVSGFTMKLSGHAVEWRTAPLWSGGDYGPEGGLFCTLVVGIAGYLLFRAPVHRQQLALLRAREDVG